MRLAVRMIACLGLVGGIGLATSTQTLAETPKVKPNSTTMSIPHQSAKSITSPSSEVKGPEPTHSIALLQEALNSEGAHVKIDGVWRPATQSALRDYQKVHGLQVTGLLDQTDTWSIGPDRVT
jgi:peptidoglycan hydrolase-like protein with peptidoglycan-binding domain